VAVVVVALLHRYVPAPRWLLVHLLLLGAATHSILVWSQFFADALLHAAPDDRALRQRKLRLALLNLGVVAVVAGVVAARWQVTAAGAAAVSTAVAWHAVSLVAQLRRSLGSRFATTVRYYVASASLLPLGALLGVLLTRGLGEAAHARVMTAHVELNVLGWIGLTVLGTLVTLWPTMLRTRMDEGAERAARTALPVLLLALLTTVVATLVGTPSIAGAALLGYVAGIAILARPFVRVMVRKPPAHFATWSVLAGVVWLSASVVLLAGVVITAPDWQAAHERLDLLTPALAVGFVAQVLTGALSYLVPVNVGRGPSGARAANAVLDRAGAARVVATNLGLVVCLLPISSAVRVTVSVVVLVSLASFVPLLFLAIRAARRARNQPPGVVGPVPSEPAGRRATQGFAGLSVVVLALALGVAIDPTAVGRSSVDAAGGISATGETTTVEVTAADMRFTPATISVPAGDRLVIRLTNVDTEDVHDLKLESGADSGRLAPGESATIDVGVVGRDLSGWCSVIGHRQMGMVLAVEVDGEPPEPDDEGGPAFAPYDAALPPPSGTRVHRQTLRITEQAREVAPGVTQQLWTYNGTAPGPVLHGRVGDRFVIRLVNDGTVGHSVDFHAGERAPDRVMRTIPPGESLVYRFRATRAGIWMYHCSTRPMSAHIANGLFGAVVIEPRRLPPVDRSYVLVQSELYLGEDGQPVDVDKVLAEQPDLVAFNGYANQYDDRPLRARVGERIRIWVLDAGPNRASSFHVVGGQFDTVWSEGSYLLDPRDGGDGGAQVLPLLPAQGGFVELVLDEPGSYPFISHLMVDAERGAHGILAVRP